MNELWVDANILLRFITKDPPDLAERAYRLVARAERGEVQLRVTLLVVAEAVWVLGSYYRFSRRQIADVMLPLIVADGVVTEQLDVVVGALSVMASANVAFVDAFLAEVARRSSGTVASFDRDFGRLDVQWVQPD